MSRISGIEWFLYAILWFGPVTMLLLGWAGIPLLGVLLLTASFFWRRQKRRIEERSTATRTLKVWKVFRILDKDWTSTGMDIYLGILWLTIPSWFLLGWTGIVIVGGLAWLGISTLGILLATEPFWRSNNRDSTS